ncbi:MAG: class I SAM-dependent RNA methyltransferase [Eubacteriales bacterium]|nr:class I SAM-dependent RNA methyltransferase [Eubacteriales bacterium]
MAYKCFASCAFGLESVTASELKKLGYSDVITRDARVYFCADEASIAKANIRLRSADRVYIEIARFDAESFDALFEGVRAVELERYIPKDAQFIVNADSVKSRLFSVSDIQSICKKAAATRLMEKYHTSVLHETGQRYDIHIKILGDTVSVCLNTSGPGLNRRGYRAANVQAPIRETLAAGLVLLTGWKDGDFCDPMCGSGTIAIEAAMIGANIAPGLNRAFDAEKWRMFENEWRKEREAARQNITAPRDVYASDIDKKALSAAAKNADNAGVSIKLYHADVRDFSRDHCIVLTNPPYAERMGDRQSVHRLYRDMGEALARADKKFIITADDEFERYFGKRAAKKRKLYNGNIRCTLYQYF